MSEEKSNPFRSLIVVASTLIPIAVAALYFLPKSENVISEVLFLPKLNALLNTATSLLLIIAFWAIKNKKIELHRSLMFGAIVLSTIFLLSYVTYHSIAESTPFGGEGIIRYVYFFILLSHILLAIVIVPLVLISFTRALSEKFDKHKKIARITLPLWLYVTITGVIVYLMISPYY
jgi:putative membrane protein